MVSVRAVSSSSSSRRAVTSSSISRRRAAQCASLAAFSASAASLSDDTVDTSCSKSSDAESRAATSERCHRCCGCGQLGLGGCGQGPSRWSPSPPYHARNHARDCQPSANVERPRHLAVTSSAVLAIVDIPLPTFGSVPLTCWHVLLPTMQPLDAPAMWSICILMHSEFLARLSQSWNFSNGIPKKSWTFAAVWSSGNFQRLVLQMSQWNIAKWSEI